MLLDSTTKSLEILLGGAVTTNQLPVVVFYVDHTTTLATPGEQDTQTDGASAVTIVSAPGGLTQRQIKEINIYNADTVSTTITVRLNNNSTYRILTKITLGAGEILCYLQETGWVVLDPFGLTKTGGATIGRQPSILLNMVKDAASLTAVTAFASGTCHCYFMGMAPIASSSVDLLVNITTAVATITWAEIAIYKGTPTLNGVCPDLVRLGWVNVAAVYNSTGIKKTTISLATALQPGDNIWVVMGCSATTPFQVRGALADNIQSGLFQTLAQRPSLTSGPIASVLAGAAVVPAWLAIKIN